MPGRYTGKTRAEARAMVLANNKNKNASDKSRQNMVTELKLWSAQNKSSEKTTSTNTEKEKTTKGHSNYGQGTKVNSELARDETYSDYAAEIRGETPADDLYKSAPPKRSSFKMKGWSGYQNKK